MDNSKKRIISIDVNAIREVDLIEQLHHRIEQEESGYACFSNVHMLIEAYDNSDFAEVVNSATYALPDGLPVAKSFRVLHGISQERIAGMDFLPLFLHHCNLKEYRVAFIGSTEEVLEATRSKINRELPGIVLTHLISPPFGQSWENEKYVRQLNESNTQVVFVALGCPKQEVWMHAHTRQIDAFLFGIGGALPTYVGVIKRAPAWMRKSGLEWFYRLLKEPRRMFKRYLYTNSKFLYLLARHYIK